MKKSILLILVFACCSTTAVFAGKLLASSISIHDLHNSTLAEVYLRNNGKLTDFVYSDSSQQNDSNASAANNSTCAVGIVTKQHG